MNTVFDRIPMSKASAKFDNDKSLSTYEEFSFAVLDRKEKEEGEKLWKMIGQAFDEGRKTDVTLTTDMVVAIGRKRMWSVQASPSSYNVDLEDTGPVHTLLVAFCACISIKASSTVKVVRLLISTSLLCNISTSIKALRVVRLPGFCTHCRQNSAQFSKHNLECGSPPNSNMKM